MYELFFREQYAELVMLVTVAFMLSIFLYAIFPKFRNLLNRLIRYIKNKPDINDESFEEVLDSLGYTYDARQDIFYSGISSWQREMGYCRLYDEAAAPMSMIIDCEPIYFEYDNRKWLIEFWKGQYGITTGCEIGIYAADDPDIKTEYFNGTFYECAGEEDLLSISFEMTKNGKKLIKRKDVHWLLTGFKLGEFSEPGELSVFISIKLKDKVMRDEFIGGLKSAGYNDEEIVIINNTVSLVFEKPRTEQPYTRTELTDCRMQTNNKDLCEKFNKLTYLQDNSIDKLLYLKNTAPDLFEEFCNMIGRNKELFNVYWDIKD